MTIHVLRRGKKHLSLRSVVPRLKLKRKLRYFLNLINGQHIRRKERFKCSPRQDSPILQLPIKLLVRIFDLPPVTRAWDLNQDFISRFCAFGAVCSTFRKIALSRLRDYCAVVGFTSYAPNINYLRNMVTEHHLIKWQKDANGNTILKRHPQMSPIAQLPIELLDRVFYLLLPAVSHIQDLDQEFVSQFCILAGICSAFRNIALSALQHYCVLFADNFSSYALNMQH
ncbi:hypothetical protein BT69DRAFT_676488 [Atractiella rhizophila]|nr:hypothetical protein BT69DRAFT_1148798 [Atractiella rhizophila]KAH8917309.1 hypothetical protein BT69DRAFT_676488 [Atractiella rhizophila]